MWWIVFDYKQCQNVTRLPLVPRQRRHALAFIPPSAPSSSCILFLLDAPVDNMLVTSTSQHEAPGRDGGCRYRGSSSLCACVGHIFWFDSLDSHTAVLPLHVSLAVVFIVTSSSQHHTKPLVTEIPLIKLFLQPYGHVSMQRQSNHVTSFLLMQSNSICVLLCRSEFLIGGYFGDVG